ncbi:MAG: iron-sulfur cluster assembly accessory protein [Armatimonadetes bacterium]|nr:iron-sulfur cluster assembly accessory protein [Armatimonadota bacterium]
MELVDSLCSLELTNVVNAQLHTNEPDFPLSLTDRAVTQTLRVREKEGKQDHFLRIGVKGGGCSGLEYVLRLDTKRTPHDMQKDFAGLTVIVDAKSAVYLAGTTLDFTGDLLGGGYKFENPNAQRSCGCGTSFTPR